MGILWLDGLRMSMALLRSSNYEAQAYIALLLLIKFFLDTGARQ
jgi:hypothetical protein